MMVLADAGRADWLEGRRPLLTLLGFQDDATGHVANRRDVGTEQNGKRVPSSPAVGMWKSRRDFYIPRA